MVIVVHYKLGRAKKKRGDIKLIVEPGWTYIFIKKLISKEIDVKYTSIHISDVDIMSHVNNKIDYSKPYFRPRYQQQHIPRI